MAFTPIPPTGLSFRNHVADETLSLFFIFQMTMMIASGAERERGTEMLSPSLCVVRILKIHLWV